MTVEKSIDLKGTASTIEDAVGEAVHRAGLTLQGLTSFEVTRIEGVISDGDITYRVHVRVSFVIKEHVHE